MREASAACVPHPLLLTGSARPLGGAARLPRSSACHVRSSLPSFANLFHHQARSTAHTSEEGPNHHHRRRHTNHTALEQLQQVDIPADPTRRKSQRWSRSARPSTTPRARPVAFTLPEHRGLVANIWFAAAATRTAGATSSPSVAPTARDALLRTRPSRDLPSATWLSPPLSVRHPDSPF